MSWLARSIANTLKLDDDDDSETNKGKHEPGSPQHHDDDDANPTSPSRGVREDLSELTRTLTSQFWGVASFLAPPPQQSQSDPDPANDPVEDPDGILGIRSDFAEMGGKFKSGISKLSNNINVSEITKIASNFLQLESDDEEGDRIKDDSRKGAVGVTEEVVGFAGDIAMHPETWLDFPLPESDDEDFDMSYAQQEHAFAVERLVPRLAAVRNDLSPEYISESYFWKIYFVLLHPRLDNQAAEFLSTDQIVKARALLAQELKDLNATKLEEKGPLEPKGYSVSHHEESLSVPSKTLSENELGKASVIELDSATIATAASEKHPIEPDEVLIVEKSVVKESDNEPAEDQNTKVSGEKDEDDGDGDEWLKEEGPEIGGPSGTTIRVENDDDVSFSDLEDDDGDIPPSLRKANDSSDKESQDWVQLRNNSSSESSKDGETKQSGNRTVNVHDSKGSNDWSDIDDIDVA